MILTIPSFGLGPTGGDRVLISIANNFVKRGHIVYIVNLGKKAIPYPISSRVHVIRLPKPKLRKSAVEFIMKGSNTLARHLPPSDIYLANWVYTVLPCITNIAKGKTVFLAQANEARDFTKPSLQVLKGLSYEALMLRIPIVVPSKYIRTLIRRRFHNTSIIIPPFVDSNLFRPSLKKRSGPLKLLFVGSTKSANKGFDLLLKACSKIRGIDFELHIATQEPIKLHTTFPSVVHHPKNDKELAAIYRNSDVFFHLSKEEGFGLTLLEAMASGLICVVTDSGGVNDFAVSQKNAIFVERTSLSIASAIRTQHGGLETFTGLQTNARKTALLYTEKRMIGAFEKLLLQHSKKGKEAPTRR